MLAKEDVLSKLRRMDPYRFEKLIADLWERKGYQTKVRSAAGDRGIDIEARNSTGFELIQAKRYDSNNRIGSRKIREYATLYQQVQDASKVVIVTTGDFTPEAERLAQDLSVELIDCDDLFNLLNDLAPDVAIEYLQEIEESEEEDEDELSNPFRNPHEFSKISPNQGYYDECRATGCSGRVWYGERYSKRYLKCERCGGSWVEVEKNRGFLERLFGSTTNKVEEWTFSRDKI